jgi:photosystem II stability/assembly factor-like uncharacterized protein
MNGARAARLRLAVAALCLVLVSLPDASEVAASIEPAARQSAPRASRFTQAPMLDVGRCGDRLVAVGPRGLILVSADDGQTWAQQPSPSDVTLTSLTCIGDRDGFAVGHEETLLRTNDGGLSWQLIHTDASGVPLLRIRFIDARTGFATGGSGVLFSTTDGGTTWSRTTVTTGDGFDPHLFDIAATNDGSGRLILAGDAGRLFRSEDSGNTWHEIKSPYTGSFFGLAALGPGKLIAFGMLGHMFVSDDAGTTWDELSTSQNGSLFSSDIAKGQLYFAGADGAVATSTSDNPQQLSVISVPDRANITGLVATSDSLVYATDRGMLRTPLPALSFPR